MDLNNLSKKQTGVIFIIVYGFTMLGGAIMFLLLVAGGVHFINSLLIVDIIMTVVVFICGVILKNASLYDPYWSVIPLFYIIVFTLVFSYVEKFTIYYMLIVLVFLFWSIRLTYNWWKNWNGFMTQDWRYDLLKEKNPKLYPITNLFGIHLIPTIVVFIQLINIFDIVQHDTYNYIILIIGLLICLSGPIIQIIADKQMYIFKTNNKENKKIIDVGIWRYSRHPNYFGELLFWIGVYVIYLAFSRTIDYHIIFPVIMILLFVFISIPMMENKLKNREGYQEYKKKVSCLIPFFPKK
jgi:steroid 5-alpha reductase family enzyme